MKKTYDSKFKSRVALEAIQGNRMIAVRHETVAQLGETRIVGRLQQMDHLMNDDDLKALTRLLGQFTVEPDGPGGRVATAYSVFIRWTKKRSTFTSISRSHSAIKGGSAGLTSWHSHSLITAHFLSLSAPGCILTDRF